MSLKCHEYSIYQVRRNRPSSRFVPAISGTRPPAPCDSRFAGESLIIPPGPSRAGRKGKGSIAKLGLMAATMSDSLADMRQANVLSGDAVTQDGTLAAKSIQEEKFRLALKLTRTNAVPDSKICEMCHSETRYLIDAKETRACSSSSNSGKIVVEVVKGCRHRLCALSEDGDLSWSVIPAMARGQLYVDIPCGDLHQTMRYSSAPTPEQHVGHAGQD